MGWPKCDAGADSDDGRSHVRLADPVRRQRSETAIRWCLKVEPVADGGKALAIDDQFKLEYARDVAIADIMPRK